MSGYYRPTLKSGVDVQLQTAFSDGNWATAIRLADKRAKSLNDPYYEIVKVCAESQLEGPVEKCAALITVDELVRKGTVVKDANAIDLLDWACQDLKDSFSHADTIGVLRTRWVKANPRTAGAVQSLRACVQNWDLVNAQQIAAILDKASPTPLHPNSMCWNIILSYMLSTSPQCPPDKQKIYGMLSQKQLERAAELTEASFKGAPTADSKDSKVPDRGLHTEEEILLFYRVLADLASHDDYLRWMKSPAIGALKQFDEGRKHLFNEAITIFEAREQWQAVFDFCLHALSRKDPDGSPSFFASDLSVWRSFIRAASRLPNEEETLAQAQSLLSVFATAVASGDVPPLYAKSIGLALLDLTFSLPHGLLLPSSISGSGQVTSNPRLAQLSLFLDQHGDKVSALDNIRPYVERLHPEETQELLHKWIPGVAKTSSRVTKADLDLLLLKLNYLLISKQPRCLLSATQHLDLDVRSSLMSIEDISAQALSLLIQHNESSDAEATTKSQAARDEKAIDLVITAAISLLKQAGLQPSTTRHPKLQQLRSPQLFLQAVLLLDTQLQRTPVSPPLRLLLAQLYLMLGCASYAYQIWMPLDVKRTIQDSLSPLFFDRIASVSPGLFNGPRPLMEPLRVYYSQTLKVRSPIKIWDAFRSGRYSSVLGMADYSDRLRRSSTLVMTVVEERRATRALGGRLDSLESVSFLGDIPDDTTLVSTIDCGSVPDLEASTAPSFAESLGVGPPPSNTRSHLALLSEEFLNLCAFAPPKDHKPSKTNDAAALDLAFVTERLSSVHDSLTSFMHLPDTPSHLTGAELSYYTILTFLSGLLLTSLTNPRTDPVPSTIGVLASSAKTTLAMLRSSFLSTPPSTSTGLPDATASTFWQLTEPHTLSTLRDAALAIRHTVSFAHAHHDRETARDKSGKSGVHKDIMAQLKTLDKVAREALDDISARIKSLKSSLGGVGPRGTGWLDVVLEWTFGDEDDKANKKDGTTARAILEAVGGRGAAEEWAGKVLESWREGWKGWEHVKTE